MKRRVLALLLGIAMLFSEFSSIPYVFSVSRALAMNGEAVQQIEMAETAQEEALDEPQDKELNVDLQENDSAVPAQESYDEETELIEEAVETAAAELVETAAAEPTETAAAEPTKAPTVEPTAIPTAEPTVEATEAPTAEPTETPTAEPTETATAEPTEAPTAEPTETAAAELAEAPTVEPTAVPTAEPTVEPTEAPTAEPTAIPTAEPTEAPTVEPTEAPTAEPTEAPTAEPTEAPTVEPTAIPTAEPTVEATEAPTAEPTEAPTTEPTEAPTTEPTLAPTAEPGVEPTEAPTAEPTAVPTNEPIVTPIAEPTVEPTVTPTVEPTPVPTEEPELPQLEVGIRSSISYLFAGEGSIPLTMTVSGGVAPFVMELSISANGEQVDMQRAHLEGEGMLETSYAPLRAGDHLAYMTVTDAAGQTASAKVTVPVAAHDVEYPATWEATVEGIELTGDWREDLVTIAQSQLGYQESRINFVVENGVRRGYTRYGDWYGAPYTDWCGAFISFCLSYAGISKQAYPQNAGVAAYMEAIDERGALEGSDYMPRRGDLVFFMWDGEEAPSHMGIVEDTDEITVWTIEGNAADSVARKSYTLDAKEIIAYANTSELMRQAGVDEEKTAEPDVQMSGEATTVKDSVNMRSQAKQGSALVRKLKEAGTPVQLLGATDQEDARWYLVQYHDAIGYIRGDLLTLTEPEPTEEPEAEPESEEEQTEVPAEEPTDVPAAEPTAAPEDENELIFVPGVVNTSALGETTQVMEEQLTPAPTQEPAAQPNMEPEADETAAPAGEEEELIFAPDGMNVPMDALLNAAPEATLTVIPVETPEATPTAKPTRKLAVRKDGTPAVEATAGEATAVEATAGEAEIEKEDEPAAVPETDREKDQTLSVEKLTGAQSSVTTNSEQILIEATPGEAQEAADALPEDEIRIKYTCGLEAHTHTGDCFGDFLAIICGKEEHEHTDECTLLIEQLSVELTSDAERFVIGESARVIVQGAITGGYGPYAVSMNVHQGDTLLQSAQMTTEGNAIRFFFVPEQPGEYLAEVTVTDADGYAVQAKLPMTIAEPEPEYYCGLEEHAHGETCVDADGDEVCDLVAHEHDDSCLIPPVEEPEDGIATLTLTPDENGNVSFSVDFVEDTLAHFISYWIYDGSEEIDYDYQYTNNASYTIEFAPPHAGEYAVRVILHGIVQPDVELQMRLIVLEPVKYFCGLTAHEHSDDCYKADELVCGLEAHEHDLYCLAEKLTISLFAENQTLDYNDPFVPVTVNAVITGGIAPYTVGMHVRGEKLPQSEQAETEGGAQETAAAKTVLESTAAVGEAVQEATPGEAAEMPRTEHGFTFVPVATGAHTVTVSVTDADGRVAQETITVNVDRLVSAWEEALQNVVITGNSREDIPAVARTQLGYTEYEIDLLFGDETPTSQVYTIYGEWYNELYGALTSAQSENWSNLFTAFCLHYAGLSALPVSAEASPWAQLLADSGLLKDADSYMPLPGDVVFLDTDGDQIADDTALVDAVNVEAVPFKIGDDGSMNYVDLEASYAASVLEPENPYNIWLHSGAIDVIAGDVDGTVAMVTIDVTDPVVTSNSIALLSLTADSEPVIVGYGSVAENTESDEVAAVIQLIEDMPSADEYDALLLAYEETEKQEDFDALMEAQGRVEAAYYAYMDLLPAQRAYVTNIDKFMELEYVWSRLVYIDEITSDTPHGFKGVSTTDFVQLNLYDYGSNINTNWNNNKKWPGFQWNGGAYMKSGESFSRTRVDNIDFGNSMITDYDYGSPYSEDNPISPNRKNVVKQGGAINTIGDDYTNVPTGLSTKDATKMAMGNTLSSDGYPILATGDKLDWLFKNGTYADKQNSANIDHLFQIEPESGEYYYDSRLNHAQYGGNEFTLYEQIITPNFIMYPFGNFLPLNDITQGSVATQVSKITRIGTYVQEVINDLVYEDKYANDNTAKQLIDMLARYRTNLKAAGLWDNTAARPIIEEYLTANKFGGTITNDLLSRLYNIDWDVDTNFFFGMEMRMNFMQPKDAMVGTDHDNDGIPDYPMKFYFAGDDDVWVYIDNVLFLDLSGIHRHVGGDIDFKNGVVNYYAFGTYVDGAIQSDPYATYTFADILTTYGGVAQADLGKYLKYENGKYTTFLDYSSHKFDFFYMERGSGSSVCRINFNFPLLRKNAISVLKEVTGDIDKAELLGNPDYKFQILKADANGTKTNEPFIVKDGSAEGIPYNIYDGEPTDGKEPIGTGVTGKDGVFTLKAGQSAEFIGISENAGKYYVRELLDGNELAQYGKITVSGETATQVNGIVIDGETFSGLDSTVKDMSNGTTAFRFINNFESDKLGSIEIEKKLTDDQMQDAMNAPSNKLYRFFVALGGEPLPVGTVYIVDDGIEREDPLTRTVEEAGIVEVKADEKIVVDKIYAGLKYTITEDEPDYNVSYKVTGDSGYGTSVDEVTGKTTLSGVIRTSTMIEILATNTVKGDQATPEVIKSLPNHDSGTYTYTFDLVQIDMDDMLSYTVTENGYTDQITIDVTSKESVEKAFKTMYFPPSMAGKTYCYLITEAAPPAGSSHDATKYIYMVEVKQDAATGDVTATPKLYKLGANGEDASLTLIEVTQFEFVNKLLGDIHVEKRINGIDTIQEFPFTLVLTGGLLPGTYTAKTINKDKTVDETSKNPTTITVETANDGTAPSYTDTIYLKQDQEFVIYGLPIGTVWSIVEHETAYPGADYAPSVSVNGTVTENTAKAAGTLSSAGAFITIINTQLFELPSTGGNGTYLYTMGGFLLMAASIFLLYSQRKYRKEDYET